MSNILNHWSVLKEPHISADICFNGDDVKAFRMQTITQTRTALKKNYKENSFTPRTRGSAISKKFDNTHTDTGKYSGFGMFTDKMGNLILVLDYNRPASRLILNNYLGKYHSIYKIAKTEDNSWTEDINDDPHERANEINNGGLSAKLHSYKDTTLILDDGTPHKVNKWVMEASKDKGSPKYQRNDYFKLLEYIEEKNLVLKGPLVLYIPKIVMNKPFDVLGTAFSIISIFAPVPPLFTNLVKGTVAIAQGENPLTVATTLIPGIENKIGEMFKTQAELLAPEFTKGANVLLNDAKTQIKSYGKHIEKAGKSAESVIKDLNYGAKNMAKTLDMEVAQVENYLARYKGVATIQSPIDMRRIKGSMHETNKILRNTSNMLTVRQMNDQIDNGSYITKIDDMGGAVTEVPVINDMFIGGGAGAVLRAIPQADKLISKIIDSTSDNLLDGKKGTEAHASLIGSAFGYPMPEQGFDVLTYSALLKKAEAHTPDAPTLKNKILGDAPFIMPDSIPDEDKHRYAKKLKEDTGVDVWVLTDSFDWDIHKRKLVVAGASVLVGALAWHKSPKLRKTVKKQAKTVSKKIKGIV